MGKRGPAKTPTKLAVLRGERKDRLNFDEPLPDEDAPIVPPDTLSEQARIYWDRYAPDLMRVGVLTAWDVDSFAVCCEALARYWAATRLVNGSALLVNGTTGLTPNPALKVQREAEQTFAQFGGRFGLSPSDRTAIKVNAAGGSGQGPNAERLLS